jgi:copper transport protein
VRRRRAALIAFIAAWLIVAAIPSVAWGHASFLGAQPEPGTRLPAGPSQIAMTFSEPLNRELSTAKLVNLNSGARVPATVGTSGERQLILRPQVRLGRAPYRVEWHTVSTLDGHPLEGAYSFGVRTAAVGGEQAVEQSPLARGGWLRIAARAVLYASLFFFAGGVINAALLAPRGRPERWLLPETIDDAAKRGGINPAERAQRWWRRTLAAGAIATMAAIAVALIETSDAGGGLSAHSIDGYLLSNLTGLARVGTVVAIALALLFARRWTIAAAATLAIAFLTISLSGHANSANPRALAVFTDWVHVVAAAIWVGGIAQLAAAWLPGIRRAATELRQAVIRSVLPRFGRVALPAFVVVLVTGSTNALIQLGRPQELWQSAYGRVLAVKILLVGLIAVASYMHALRIRPRLLAANPHPSEKLERREWRLLGSEPWLGLGALIAVAALVAFPLPPRQLSAADQAEAAAPCSPSCPLPGAAPDQLPVADRAGQDIVGFWLRRDGEAVSGTVRVLDLDGKPVDASVDVPGGSADDCGLGCWRVGAPHAGPSLTVSVGARGHDYPVTVPASFEARRNTEAEALLRRAQTAMRGLGSFRLREELTSGTGIFVHTDYRFQAPDRMAYETSSGSKYVAIGKVTYDTFGGSAWEKQPFGGGSFRVAALFTWTVYGRTVRLLGENRRFAQLALFDPGTPIWYRLKIDRRTYRVVAEHMTTGGHFMDRRYFDFNRPVRIEPPK